MTKNKLRSWRFNEALIEKAKAAAEREGMKIREWVEAAIREKLKREGG